MTRINSNGHGALHKAAQRNRLDVVDWVVHTVLGCLEGEPKQPPPQFCCWGPDADGCCPSDLAGMEGHTELAERLVRYEISLSMRLCQPLPSWLNRSTNTVLSSCTPPVWEPWGGVCRIQQALHAKESPRENGGMHKRKRNPGPSGVSQETTCIDVHPEKIL
mmetsp:Transcript_13115/g.30542  ORF Transcript_13115/g.30542 Transcript_13115/m.30542 type:complete len:162 (+) Transcript_13115:313-798(+)|eukprot:CAMPEP_0116859848 /NCGR_PEP_ID=MMETSP0418-20121206/22069_1 /TAXON_ID=1158023 /ORGANISM="Astrosyne radiata, Strain 13vi08-1A" /LENGTH=161 /DNA_ID=CAMNT_0004494153 /DNA_START=544 /DNA_END=1029 /DNA_ORIENTATION=-